MRPLDWQVQQARRWPIPTAQQQVLLGRTIRAWQDHVDGPDGAPPLIQKRGRRALDRLVSGNLRLVVRLVLQHRDLHGAMDQDDLMQLGSEGLIRAALKYRPDLGYSFSTYALWWVRQALQRSRRDRYSIALPHQLAATIHKCRAVLSTMEAPDLDAAAARCSTASRTLERSDLERALRFDVLARAASIDATTGDQSSSLEAVLFDPEASNLWGRIERDNDNERLERALSALSPNERQMVEEVVINGDSFQAVARRLGLHRDTVRRRHGRALTKLRASLEAPCAA